MDFTKLPEAGEAFDDSHEYCENLNSFASKETMTMEVLDVQNAAVDESVHNLWTDDPNERVKLRMEESGIGSEEPMTVHTLFARCARQWPNHTALAYKKDPSGDEYTKISFLEYYRLSLTAAKGFIKLGLDPKHSVGILGFNSVEWFLTLIGTIFAGGFACGIYTTNSAEVCQHIATDSCAQIIVVDTEQQMKKILSIRDRLPELRALIQWKGDVPDASDEMQMTWEQFMRLGADEPNSIVLERLRPQLPNECCSLIYTSGTTGNPKGAMLSHDNLTWTARSTFSFMKLKVKENVLISYLPLSHVAAQVTDVFVTMTAGATIYFAQPDAFKGSLGTTLKEVRPTVFLGVPRVWEKMQEKMMAIGRSITWAKKAIATWAKDIGHRGSMAQMIGEPVPWGWTLANLLLFHNVKQNLGLDRCHISVSAAAPITKETLEYFMSLDIKVVEVYGLSETSGPHAMSRPSTFYITAAGVTPPGTNTKIFNPDADGNGEICMYGRNVFMGYLRDREKTETAIDSEGWFHSGDLGKIDEKGFLFITGRLKELLITAGGENVAPVPIEDRVKEALPCLSNCMLIGDKRKFISILLTLRCELDNDQPLDQLSEPAISWLRSVGGCGPEVTTVSAARRICEDRSSPLAKAIQAGIDAVNAHALSRVCTIQKWSILSKDFSVVGGELGPTMKLRRPVVCKMYASTINAFYEE